MNKQELIKRIEDLPYKEGLIVDKIDISRKGLLELVSQLDEPGKVQIPQSVADWIKKCKTFKSFAVSLSFALQPSVWEVNGLSGECIEWLTDAENQEIFARAWLDGYEVEKEKRYRISMPKARNHKNHAQILCENDSKMFWCAEWYSHRTKFTRKELEEAGFDWVFDSPGIKVQKVE